MLRRFGFVLALGAVLSAAGLVANAAAQAPPPDAASAQHAAAGQGLNATVTDAPSSGNAPASTSAAPAIDGPPSTSSTSTTLMCDPLLVPPPQALTVTARTTTSITLSWTDAMGALFDVYRDGRLVGTTRYETHFTDTGLTPGTQYTYYVIARIDSCRTWRSTPSPSLTVTAPIDTTTAAPPECTAELRVVTEWGTGFIANVTVTNPTTDALTGWSVNWSWPGTQHVGAGWNATVTSTGIDVTAHSTPWNGSVAAGSSTTFGLYIDGPTATPAVACRRA